MIGRYPLVEPMVPDQPIEVEPVDRPRAGVYQSSVVAVTPAHIAISRPKRRAELLKLTAGATLRVRYQGQVSKYAFESVVREVQPDLVILDLPANIDIASRRADRVTLKGAPITVVRLDHDAAELLGAGIDVSAWGIQVVLPEPLAQWERVRLIVTLPDGPMTLDAQVVRIEQQGPSDFAHGLYYPHLTSEELSRLRQLGG
jgi:c-di-GMP-binding flagellar brake protein YcgR